MITEINMNIEEVLKAKMGLAEQRFVDPEEYATFDSKNDVLRFITSLIEDKLRNLTIKSNETLTRTMPDVYGQGDFVYTKLVDIKNIVREVAIYYTLAFVEDENISEDLVQSAMDFIMKNFDIKEIVTNFSQGATKLRFSAVDIDTMSEEDIVLSYSTNEQYLANEYVPHTTTSEELDKKVVGVAPTDPQVIPVNENKEGK